MPAETLVFTSRRVTRLQLAQAAARENLGLTDLDLDEDGDPERDEDSASRPFIRRQPA